MSTFIKLLYEALEYARSIVPACFLARTKVAATGEPIDCIRLASVPSDEDAEALAELGFRENVGPHGASKESHSREWLITNKAAFRGDEDAMAKTEWNFPDARVSK